VATAPASAGLTVAAACGQFYNAAYTASHSSPTDPAALKRFGNALMHAANVPSDHHLRDALLLAGARALALGYGVTPSGPAAAYRAAQRALKAVGRACKGH
jgi:hypothetical protein